MIFFLFSLAYLHSWLTTDRFKQSESTEAWERIKPSKLGDNKPKWMTFDDQWVDEVHRGLSACKVFLWYPLFCMLFPQEWSTHTRTNTAEIGLAYNQMLNNLTSQAATMHLGGVPNDIINNLNPFALIISIPIMDRLIYPWLRRMGIHFTPIKRITAGFFVAGCSMISATVTQHYIYKKGPCGKEANLCVEEYGKYSDISVWVQAVTYVLGGISEIFASITSLEYAFTKAPINMRSLIQAVALFMNAFSSAIGQAMVSLSEDPLLVWNYAVTAILAFVGCIGFWLTNYKLDREEDKLNNLPQSHFSQQQQAAEEEGDVAEKRV